MKNTIKHDLKPKWEKVKSHLCLSDDCCKPVKLCGEPITKGQFGFEIHPVICKSGLVYLNPRWTSDTYNNFYKTYYDSLYRLELKPDYGVDGVRSNMQQVWERSKHYFNSGKTIKNVLDAGCGSGHGLGLLKELMPDIKIYGIEASPDCCRILEEQIGAELIDTDIDGSWISKYEGYFDFIILRHVVEHFLDPIKSLKTLHRALSPQGVMYIAVPDMMHPRTKLRDYDKWWEYWFRAVHPYYYNQDTLFTTLHMAGLNPVAFGEENEEVWCLVSSIPKQDAVLINKKGNIFERQNNIIESLLP